MTADPRIAVVAEALNAAYYAKSWGPFDAAELAPAAVAALDAHSADVREAIAQAIEACIHHSDTHSGCDYCLAYARAARIARNGGTT